MISARVFEPARRNSEYLLGEASRFIDVACLTADGGLSVLHHPA